MSKPLLYSILLFLLQGSFLKATAQRYDWRERVDLLVRNADSLSNKSQKTFYTLRYLKNDQTIKETWHYTMKEGKIIIFQLRYLLDETEFNEVYYLSKGQLLCMEQYESPAQLADASISNAEVYFFDGSEMKQFIQYGKRQRGYAAYTSSNQCLEKFGKRYEELLRNMKHTPNMGE